MQVLYPGRILVFVEGGQRRTRAKTLGARQKKQQTQPIMTPGSNQTLMGGD